MAVTQTGIIVPDLKEIQESALEMYKAHNRDARLRRRVHDKIRFARLDQDRNGAYIDNEGRTNSLETKDANYWVTPDRKLKVRLADHWFLVTADLPLGLDEKAIPIFLRDILDLKELKSALAVIGSVVDVESSPKLQEQLRMVLESNSLVNGFEHDNLKISTVLYDRHTRVYVDFGYSMCVEVGNYSPQSGVLDLLERIRHLAYEAIT